MPVLDAAAPIQPATLLVAQADRPVALVVDDDPDTRRHIASTLAGAGWNVCQASNGEQALLLAREHVPELILLDLALPGISGLEVLRTLKRWIDQPTRVVVVSFYAGLMRLPDLRLADGVVQKPFAAADLLAEVARVRPAAAMP
jgi:CheY-like chemotaxis protein